MRYVLAVLLSFVFCMQGLPAFATAATADSPLARLDSKTEEIMKGLDQSQILQFEKIRTAHGTIRAVQDVRRSLENAVKSCTKANPDIADTMTPRLQAWKNSVLPVVRQGENRLEKMILSQGFARPSEVRAYLKVFDNAVKHGDGGYTEVPISAQKECLRLVKNMDQSEKIMAKLITETLGLDRDLKTSAAESDKK